MCPAILLIGFLFPLNETDFNTLNTAGQNCKKYYSDAPCLIKLTKKEELLYNAVCGSKLKKEQKKE